MAKRKWYHVSYTWKGETIRVKPRVCDRMPDEPQVPRICVCPSIEECFLAMGEYRDIHDDFHVYVCESDDAIPAYGVHDSHITQEHWFTQPQTFKLMRIVTNAEMMKFPVPPCGVKLSAKGNESKAREVLNQIEDVLLGCA